MYTVYAISSINRNYIYIGLAGELESRLKRHNSGYEGTTRPYRPFKLILQEEFPNRKEARKREKYLKTGIGREYVRQMLK